MFDKTITISSTDGKLNLIIVAGTEGEKSLMLRQQDTLQKVTDSELMDLLELGLNAKKGPPPASPPNASRTNTGGV